MASQMTNERKMTYKFWYNHWKNHNFASSEEAAIGPVTWAELVKKFGTTMIVDAHIEGIIRVLNDSKEITEFPPQVDPANDEKTLYRIHFKGENFVKDLRYQIIMDLNDEDLEALHKKYPTEDTFSCPDSVKCEDGTKTLKSIELSTYKFWFEHWSGIDYNGDLFDEQAIEELEEEYGMENMVYAANKGWVEFYFGGGVIDDIAAFECPDDVDDALVEMYFDGETMAQAAKMLMDDTAYEGQLEDCNDVWGYPLDDGETGEDGEDGDSGEETDEELAPPPPIKRKREEEDTTPQKKAKVIATTAEGDIVENEDGSITLPNGVTYHSEVTSVYSDSTMPGGVIDDDGCIKKDAPNLTDVWHDDGLEDRRAEEKALENCQANHNVACTKC